MKKKYIYKTILPLAICLFQMRYNIDTTKDFVYKEYMCPTGTYKKSHCLTFKPDLPSLEWIPHFTINLYGI